MSTKLCLFSGLVVGAYASGAIGDVVMVQCSRDNTLYQNATGTISNGAGPYIFAGVTQGASIRRALIRFDVASEIPAGSIISGAVLRLNLSRTISTDVDVALYRALRDWGEGTSTTGLGQGGSGTAATANDATWLHSFYDTVFWSVPGGTSAGANPDFAATPSGVTTVADAVGVYSWGSAPGMVADAQAWLDNPAANFGWFVIADEMVMPGSKRFDSRENATAASRPVLEVTFTPPSCYANCDSSTISPCLNVNDFICYINLFAAAETAANCDGSSIPTLNVNDFVCYINAYAAQCGPGGASNCAPRP